MAERQLSLLELQQTLTRLISSSPATQNVWITAELSDVTVRNGHCYMELLEKDPAGAPVARARGVIWANNWQRVGPNFLAVTGRKFESGIKVLLRASASYHPVYGLSLVITDVDPRHTMGDLLLRRREILVRLRSEGILGLNRGLAWPEPALRVAVISSRGAAGYGDFMNQLYGNGLGLRFRTQLFEAIVQGDRTAGSVQSALNSIVACKERWDCVVLIRGGGASSDLGGFENYDLAAAIARCPLPVVVGLGHERDITLLDYVANTRVKTPTAAAEHLIARASALLEAVDRIGTEIHRCVSGRLADSRRQLAYAESLLPVAPVAAVERGSARLRAALLALAGVSGRRISPELARMDHLAGSLVVAAGELIRRRAARIDSAAELVAALSPQATLRRGYSITRAGGRTVKSVADVALGTELTTVFADGELKSTVK